MRALSLMALFVCLACSARVVRNPSSGAGSRTGLVKFQLSSLPSIDDRRREDALQKMTNSCGGPYHIVSEQERVDRAVVQRAGKEQWHVEPVRYAYIEYACDSGREPQ